MLIMLPLNVPIGSASNMEQSWTIWCLDEVAILKTNFTKLYQDPCVRLRPSVHLFLKLWLLLLSLVQQGFGSEVHTLHVNWTWSHWKAKGNSTRKAWFYHPPIDPNRLVSRQFVLKAILEWTCWKPESDNDVFQIWWEVSWWRTNGSSAKLMFIQVLFSAKKLRLSLIHNSGQMFLAMFCLYGLYHFICWW